MSQRSSSTKDYSTYDYDLKNFFLIDDCKNEFKDFLEKTMNIELFSFLESVENYKTLEDNKRYKEASKIIETYIEQFSKKEINIGMESRKTVLKNFEESSKENCPCDLFDDGVTDVLLMMKIDQFKRFAATKEFSSIVEKIGEETFLTFAKLK
eukprot:gene4562-7946_t